MTNMGPQVELSPIYKLELTKREFRLLGLALMGKLVSDEDKREARGLNRRLLKSVSSQVLDLHSQVIRASEHADKDE